MDSPAVSAQHEDMSPWAVHFTQPLQDLPAVDDEPGDPNRGLTRHELAARLARLREERTPGYENIMSILWDGVIAPFAEPHGAAREIEALAEGHRSAAFAEIPLHLLGRLVSTRSPFGIGFDQRFLLANGGARVWYLESAGPAADAVRSEISRRRAAGVDPADAFWQLTPFIEFPDTDALFSDWRWEREWRVPGGLSFTPNDVAFLFIPERFHADARSFFDSHRTGNTGPAYLCPYIDVTWSRSRIAAALAGVS